MTVDLAIQASDGQPLVYPHRISRKPGHDKAILTFTLNAIPGIVPCGMTGPLVPRDGLFPGEPRYHSLRVMPGNRDLDKYGFKAITVRGVVCGLDRCGPGKRSLDLASGVIVDDITVVELDEPMDGNYTQNIHFMTDGGWE